MWEKQVMKWVSFICLTAAGLLLVLGGKRAVPAAAILFCISSWIDSIFRLHQINFRGIFPNAKIWPILLTIITIAYLLGKI